ADRQAEAGALLRDPAGAGLLEGAEEAADLVGGDAAARVLDLDPQARLRAAALAAEARPQDHAAVIGELDRVREEVQDHLPQLRRVGDELLRDRRIDGDLEDEPALLDPQAEHLLEVVQEAAELE